MHAGTLELLEDRWREHERVAVGRHVQPDTYRLHCEQLDGGACRCAAGDEDGRVDDLRGGERGPDAAGGVGQEDGAVGGVCVGVCQREAREAQARYAWQLQQKQRM